MYLVRHIVSPNLLQLIELFKIEERSRKIKKKIILIEEKGKFSKHLKLIKTQFQSSPTAPPVLPQPFTPETISKYDKS